jgi:hypothetical protein
MEDVLENSKLWKARIETTGYWYLPLHPRLISTHDDEIASL